MPNIQCLMNHRLKAMTECIIVRLIVTPLLFCHRADGEKSSRLHDDLVLLFILFSLLSSPTRLLFIQLVKSLFPVLNFKVLLKYFFSETLGWCFFFLVILWILSHGRNDCPLLSYLPSWSWKLPHKDKPRDSDVDCSHIMTVSELCCLLMSHYRDPSKMMRGW